MREREPTIAVGLLEKATGVCVRLQGQFLDAVGRSVPPGEMFFGSEPLTLTPTAPERDSFSIQTIMGINFHWQQKETQTFRGGLRLLPGPEGLTVINDVPLETYLQSVVCSEMRSSSPPELIKAHAIISRSWLLAQREPRPRQQPAPSRTDEMVRWTDRQAHTDFDVCADDHCQRYQGIGRIESPHVERAVHETYGLVLTHSGKPCDARFSKCCGGITEDFTTAWGEEPVPYLVPVFDGPRATAPEQTVREFIENPPETYCGCAEETILQQVLNPYDLMTRDFFRWKKKLGAEEAGQLVQRKLGVGLGRILSMEALERGPSGRIKRLRLSGERGSLVVGKELEIRRTLSESHLYSSAFVIDIEGPAERPEAFILHGAGWGHGVGLCQIGAAVMAWRGFGHEEILAHYYPGTTIETLY